MNTSALTLEPTAGDCAALVRILRAQAQACFQRRLLVLAGDAIWCRAVAQPLFSFSGNGSEHERVVWVSSIDLQDAEVVATTAVKSLLGQECDVVVFDAHTGFDPDAFGAVSGVIRGGGLLVLLCPPLDAWEHLPDPASERIAIWPHGIDSVSGRFIRRIAKLLQSNDDAMVVRQNQSIPELGVDEKSCSGSLLRYQATDGVFATTDQQQAVEAIEHVLHGHRRRPVVLVADRGRGKSTALGLAAVRLLQQAVDEKALSIIVTAPRSDAVATLFAHIENNLSDVVTAQGCLQYGNHRVVFRAPDDLCRTSEQADLLLVDEAAAIPVPMLTHLLANYSRIAFATTIHGYEGSGRGFAVRFRQVLNHQAPGWQEMLLTTPVRWVENDLLERFVFRALLLDAEPVPQSALDAVSVDAIIIEQLDRNALMEDESTLSQLFGLLVAAHYRTTPNDLRNLLDGPAVSVFVMRYQTHVVATALVCGEGRFDTATAHAIFAGERRPRGHLLAQSLVAHLGIEEAALMKCARVLRIAVHPALQRKGLGRRLLSEIEGVMQAKGCELLGTSFGATEALLRFWFRQGMQAVRMGFQRDHASGEHSVLMLKPLAPSALRIAEQARQHLCRDLPHWLGNALQDLEPELVLLLMTQDCPRESVLDADDEAMLQAFASGARSYEDCIGPLWRCCVSLLITNLDVVDRQERAALVMKVLQNHSWESLTQAMGVSGQTISGQTITGKKAAITVLRHAVAKLLDVSLIQTR